MKSFAINLTGNPSFGQILNQARGEKVEVVLQQTNATQPGTMTGTVIGIEKQKIAVGKDTVEVELLNLWCADGMRSLKMQRGAAGALPQSDPGQRVPQSAGDAGAVARHAEEGGQHQLRGEGKRQVRVGYVDREPDLEDRVSARAGQEERSRICRAGPSSRTRPTRTGKTCAWPWSPAGPSLSRWISISRCTCRARRSSLELFASLRPSTYSGDLANANRKQPGPTAAAVDTLDRLAAGCC